MAKSKNSEIQHGLYRLQKSQPILHPFEIHLNAFRLSHILTWSLCILHTTTLFALACSLQREETSTPWQIWIALLAESSLNIPEAMTAFTILLALFSGKAAQPRPAYRLEGHVAPSIDIMITCCGEPVEIVINTIAAAAAQDYPIGRFRVFVLDDGHDAELQQAVEMLKLRLGKTTSRSIIYLSRTLSPGEPSYFKSGNLRFGIEESQRLGTGSDFFAGLDADMVPEPSWLKSMVPHVLLQDEVAMACGPQV